MLFIVFFIVVGITTYHLSTNFFATYSALFSKIVVFLAPKNLKVYHIAARSNRPCPAGFAWPNASDPMENTPCAEGQCSLEDVASCSICPPRKQSLQMNHVYSQRWLIQFLVIWCFIIICIPVTICEEKMDKHVSLVWINFRLLQIYVSRILHFSLNIPLFYITIYIIFHVFLICDNIYHFTGDNTTCSTCPARNYCPNTDGTAIGDCARTVFFSR